MSSRRSQSPTKGAQGESLSPSLSDGGLHASHRISCYARVEVVLECDFPLGLFVFLNLVGRSRQLGSSRSVVLYRRSSGRGLILLK